MIRIINNLEPFFEDCYRRINVREYARIMKISPPTASKLLIELKNQEIVECENDRNFIFYYANKKSKDFIDLSRIYWRLKLKSLIDYINYNFTDPLIILYGSLSKGEAKSDSDIDIAIIGNKKEIAIKDIEKAKKVITDIIFSEYNRYEEY